VYPALHSQAVSTELPATEVEKEGHPWQVPGFEFNLYVPEAQMEHAPPFAPVYPALHWQADREVLPCDDCESCGHVSHALTGVLVSDNKLLCNSDATNAKSLADRW